MNDITIGRITGDKIDIFWGEQQFYTLQHRGAPEINVLLLNVFLDEAYAVNQPMFVNGLYGIIIKEVFDNNIYDDNI